MELIREWQVKIEAIIFEYLEHGQYSKYGRGNDFSKEIL